MEALQRVEMFISASSKLELKMDMQNISKFVPCCRVYTVFDLKTVTKSWKNTKFKTRLGVGNIMPLLCYIKYSI